MVRLALIAAVCVVVACRSSAPGPHLAPLKIERLEPDFAIPKGGQFIHIRGAGFDTRSPVKVFFGDRPAEKAAVLTKDRIQAVTPAGTDGESVVLRVEFPDGRKAVAPERFRFELPKDPGH